MSKKQTPKPLRILIADDHLVVRMGLSALISLEPGMSVVGEVEDGENALEFVRRHHPDVVVMDIMMPGMDGAEATVRIISEFPETRILVLTTFSASDEVVKALEAGACGAIVKDSSQKELIAAIRDVADGKRVISPEISRTIAGVSQKPQLSERHRTILEYVAKGLSNPEIGKLIGIGPDCVKAHLKIIYSRLGVATRAEAVAFALRENLLKT